MLSLLLSLLMIVGMVPLSVFTVQAGHNCSSCEDWIDGEPYCSECYACQSCIKLCIQCGVCEDCSGNEICDSCSNEDVGDTICSECAIDKGSHCPDCNECYFEAQIWCAECGACELCTEMCDACSLNLGKGLLCVDCAAQDEGHCPDCGGCYFEIQNWCEECMLCAECIEICEYCSVEEGKIICKECAISEGLHCPDCDDCYGDYGGDRCEECQICANCREHCPTHDLCMDCAIDGGYHCPGCESCGEEVTICEDCNAVCSACAEAMCENCNLCSECVEICPDCGACSNCAEICPECGEHCSECSDICDDCGYCLVCCEDYASFEGCDCSDWVCIASFDWDDHFAENHTEPPVDHYARGADVWSWDNDYHWHECIYCTDTDHYVGEGKHTFDAYNVCTECGYIKNSKIMITKQPADDHVYVTNPDSEYNESNIAHFSVRAMGSSELTYTWCKRYYVGGQPTYKPLTDITDPVEGECFDGPDLYYLASSDACCNTEYFCCIITDEQGNTVRTNEVALIGRHNYQYYAYGTTPMPNAAAGAYGHKLQCVGECCDEKVTAILPHEDENRDKICDICDYEISGIFITKQPKNSTSAYVHGIYDGYDESNIAHFSVEAEGDSELTYTWCRRYYENGLPKYIPLKDPEEGENYTGPNLDILVPRDACYRTYVYSCFITDEEGNEVQTFDVTLKAKHNYHYFKDYLSDRELPFEEHGRLATGHFVHCVGEECEKKAKFLRHEDADNNFVCDECDYRRVIDLVELTVTPPKEGQTPKYTVGRASTAYGLDGSMNNGLYWYESDDGKSNWRLIDNTTTFKAGKYYKFEVQLRTANGYEFDRHYSYNSKVLVKVNGGPGFYATKTYNKDYANYITAVCMFGECNDSVIENIVIDGVTEPIVGQKPTYEAEIRGSGYYLDVNKSAYYEEFVGVNAGKKYYYIKNGVAWFDLTDSDWVYDNETFIPGHEYQVRVHIKTEDGYTFWHNKYYEMQFAASVNGVGAVGNTSSSYGLYEQTISASFICKPTEISTVMVYNLNKPREGQTPDYSVTTAYPELYRPDPIYAGSNGVVWYDGEGNMLDPTDTFKEGEEYRVEIKIIPSQISGANVSKFVSPVSAYIDGEEIVAGGDWNMVYGNANAVYIYYSFIAKTAHATYVAGTVTSGGSASDTTTIRLYEQGYNEPAYETIVHGTYTSYYFGDIPKGTYRLVAVKNGHDVYEKTVTVNGKVTVNIVLQEEKVYMPGDVNGDGAVDLVDVVTLSQYVAQWQNLTVVEAALNTNGSGEVDLTDVVHLSQYVAQWEGIELH